jgi:nicotinate-nucleotide adenylyltransferase
LVNEHQMEAKKKGKTGLLFGSFNPIHTGHLVIANHLLQYAGLQAVWFVVSPQNPLKPGREFLPEAKRLELVDKAIAGNPFFRSCDIEFNMGSPSYTFQTLEKLREKYSDQDFVLIIGSDNLEVFEQWKDYRKIMEMVEICVYPRPGHTGKSLVSHPNIKKVNAPLMEISSSQIREMIASGKDPRYLLPEAVYAEIARKGYYRL